MVQTSLYWPQGSLVLVFLFHSLLFISTLPRFLSFTHSGPSLFLSVPLSVVDETSLFSGQAWNAMAVCPSEGGVPCVRDWAVFSFPWFTASLRFFLDLMNPSIAPEHVV